MKLPTNDEKWIAKKKEKCQSLNQDRNSGHPSSS
jgi:hypothetical protein